MNALNKVGYARTSTDDQVYGLEDQIEQLTKEGCIHIYHEHASAVDFNARTQWAAALEKAKELGNAVIVVTKCDRLARSMAGLVKIQKELAEDNILLSILDMGIDVNTDNGRFMLNILISVAAFERDLMLSRQKVGIARAKAEDALLPKHHPDKKYQGNPKTTITIEQRQSVIELSKTMTKEAIARSLNIGVASVYRILKAK